MRQVLVCWWMLGLVIGWAGELPAQGFRSVKGGASPDGRWVVAVLDSSAMEHVDALPEAHMHPYVLDLAAMRSASVIKEVRTQGGGWGRPETNVTAQWFDDSRQVVLGWKCGRMNHSFQLFNVAGNGVLEAVELPSPIAGPGNLFSHLEAHSNAGSYLESIERNGDLVVVYYGFIPKDWDAFHKLPENLSFDHNRIEVIYRQVDGEWAIHSVASPGEMKPKGWPGR